MVQVDFFSISRGKVRITIDIQHAGVGNVSVGRGCGEGAPDIRGGKVQVSRGIDHRRGTATGIKVNRTCYRKGSHTDGAVATIRNQINVPAHGYRAAVGDACRMVTGQLQVAPDIRDGDIQSG